VSGSLLTITGAGSVTVKATQAGNADYAAAAPVSVTFTVNKKAQTITFPNPGTQTFGVAPITLKATASSRLPVTYAVTFGPAKVSGSLLTITGVGTVTVKATQAGNASYAAATPVTVTFSVIPPPAPTITSLSPSSVKAGSGDTTVAIYGTHFVPGALVPWATATATGTLTPTSIAPTKLTVLVPARDLARAATVKVWVKTVGGISASATFTIN
jgi:hypothetical protein